MRQRGWNADRNSLHVPGVAFFKALHDGVEPSQPFMLRLDLLQDLYQVRLRDRFDNRSPKN
jgi:hypothetical protein